MATRKILFIGDEALRKKCRPVEKFDERLHKLLDDMADTMRAADGAGLAANQVGILRRVVVIDAIDGTGVIELINPKIVERRGEQINAEGCLSVPGKRMTVKRPDYVRVRALDRHGKSFEMEGEDFMATCVSHELDHLDGVLYVDRMIEDVSEQYLKEGDAND